MHGVPYYYSYPTKHWYKELQDMWVLNGGNLEKHGSSFK